MSNSSLFSGEYLEAVLEAAEKIEDSSARKVFGYIAFGVASKRDLQRIFERKTLRKTCQYLVNSGGAESEHAPKSGKIYPKKWENLPTSRCNVNVNVNHVAKDSYKKLFSELISDIASCGRFRREDSSSLNTQAEVEALTRDWIDWSNKYWSGVERQHVVPFTIPPGYETCEVLHTDRIIGYFVHLTNEQRNIYKHNFKLVRKIFYEREISEDLIDRIVLMQLVLEIDPFANGAVLIRNWKKKCDQYKNRQEHSDKKSWICLAAMVQKIYERAGVKWAACKMRKEYEPLQDEAEMIRKGFYIDRLRTTKTFWQHQASKKYHQSGKTITDIVILQRELREDFYD